MDIVKTRCHQVRGLFDNIEMSGDDVFVQIFPPTVPVFDFFCFDYMDIRVCEIAFHSASVLITAAKL